MTTGEIQAHLEEIYDTSISRDAISKITFEVAVAVETALVEPLDPAEGGEFRFVDVIPGPRGVGPVDAPIRGRILCAEASGDRPRRTCRRAGKSAPDSEPGSRGIRRCARATRRSNRWKPARNAFAITFEGRLSEDLRSPNNSLDILVEGCSIACGQRDMRQGGWMIKFFWPVSTISWRVTREFKHEEAYDYWVVCERNARIYSDCGSRTFVCVG
jgi:hypothetical protein